MDELQHTHDLAPRLARSAACEVPSSVLERPVFLCGHRKSGTTMLVCLFDNHPELLTYPCDSGFFYRVFPACLTSSRAQAVDAVVAHTIRVCLEKEMASVEKPGLFAVDAIADRFRQLIAATDGSPKSLLQCLMRAYGELCGQEPTQWRAWIEKTTSTEIYALEIAGWFPHAKFIHLVRDPRDNYASLKSGWQARYRFQEEDQRALLQSLLDRAGLGMRFAEANRAILGKSRYMVVRFEDLTRSPESHLSQMAAFIGVNNHPALQVPSVNGVPWRGNSFDGQKFQGLSSENIGRWPERVEREEVATIEFFLSDAMTQFGYEPATSAVERVRAAAAHYKWFNTSTRGSGRPRQ